MTEDRRLTIYLEPSHRREAEAGKINIFNVICRAFRSCGYDVEYRDLTPFTLSKSHRRGHYSLYFMQEPLSERSLTLRRAYHYPFWRIEATNERWRTDVARAIFDAEQVDPNLAEGFRQRWHKSILGMRKATADGYVFMPLQGRLLEHRSFQSMSPVEMIETVLEREPQRRLLLKLHPKETYTPSEHAALEALGQRFSRVELVEGDAFDLLAGCDYVVTQNSALAFTGFFLGKDAVVFGGIDFHHISGSVPHLGLDAAFETLGVPKPFSRYIHWFLQENSINGGRQDAQARVLERAVRFGWPV